MKKIFAILTAVSITAVCSISTLAVDKEKGEPDVIVDGSKIIFEDQNAKIVDDVTLVPARGVFEAMDCKVDWNGTDRTVTVTSSTGVREVVIAIDSNIMKISTFKTLMEKENTEYELEVPAQIINDRTMIPLRAVSEAFDSEVAWDAEAYAVNITTGDPILLDGFTYTAPDKEEMVKMYLSTNKEDALTAGDEFDVYVNAANIPQNSFCSGIMATLEYDKSKFEYVKGSTALLNNENEPIESDVSAENLDYVEGVKMAYVTINSQNARNKDGNVLKVTFKSVNGESGKIKLVNDFNTETGYGSYLIFTSENTDTKYDGNKIVLGGPITIGE